MRCSSRSAGRSLPPIPYGFGALYGDDANASRCSCTVTSMASGHRDRRRRTQRLRHRRDQRRSLLRHGLGLQGGGVGACGRKRPVDVVAPGDDLPFDDDFADFVLASHVIEHFPDPIRALKEWLRVARKYVVVIVPHRDRTFDSDRDVTTVEEFARRHAERFTSEDDAHWSVWTSRALLDMCDHFGFQRGRLPRPRRQDGERFRRGARCASTGTRLRHEPRSRRLKRHRRDGDGGPGHPLLPLREGAREDP